MLFFHSSLLAHGMLFQSIALNVFSSHCSLDINKRICKVLRKKREGENASLITLFIMITHTHGIELTFNAYALQFARRRLCCRLHLFLFAIQAFDFPHSLARLGFSIFILCVSFCFTHLVQLIDHRFMLSKKNNRPFLQWRPNDTSKWFIFTERDIMRRIMKIINKNSRATAVDLENIKLDNMSSSVFVYSMNVYCFTL